MSDPLASPEQKFAAKEFMFAEELLDEEAPGTGDSRRALPLRTSGLVRSPGSTTSRSATSRRRGLTGEGGLGGLQPLREDISKEFRKFDEDKSGLIEFDESRQEAEDFERSRLLVRGSVSCSSGCSK